MVRQTGIHCPIRRRYTNGTATTSPSPDPESGKPPRPRRWIRLSLLIFLGSLVLVGVGSNLWFSLIFRFSLFDVTNEFIDLSGAQACERLRVGWPQGVDPAAVRMVSFKQGSTRDSGSTWYRVQISPEAAATSGATMNMRGKNAQRKPPLTWIAKGSIARLLVHRHCEIRLEQPPCGGHRRQSSFVRRKQCCGTKTASPA